MMRTLMLSVLCLTLLPLAARADDGQAIKDQLNKFADAWAKDDAAGMAAVMTENATLINPVGVVAKGKAESQKLIQHEHDTIFKHTQYVIGETTMQSITPDVMVVDLSSTITGMKSPDGAAAPDFVHHLAIVFVKQDGQWLMAAARPYKFVEMAPPAK